MKTKQVIGIVIAAAVFLTVGVVGVSSAMKAKSFSNSLLSTSEFADEPSADYIGIIDIDGTIQEGTYDYFGNPAGYTQEVVLSEIKMMKESESNKAIMLLINSPGGTVYHSDEAYLALMDYKEATGRPIYAYVTEQMCSGAYYIASAADKIYCNRNATVGSIGVYIEMVNYKGLYEKLGISGEYIRSGENKAMGNSFDELTEEQRAIMQSIVDECYEQFLGVVCEGRGYTKSQLIPIADGRIYTPLQAIDNGLIDKICLYDEALAEFSTEAGVNTWYNPEAYVSSISSFFASAFDALPKSETETALSFAENNESGVPMYLAQ